MSKMSVAGGSDVTRHVVAEGAALRLFRQLRQYLVKCPTGKLLQSDPDLPEPRFTGHRAIWLLPRIPVNRGPTVIPKLQLLTEPSKIANLTSEILTL